MSQVASRGRRSRRKPGKRDEVIAAMQVAIDHVTENETGTIYYILHDDAEGRRTSIYFYELYADQAAFEAHGKSDALKAIGPALAPFMAGRPELKFLTPVQGKGL